MAIRREISAEKCRSFAISKKSEWLQYNGIGGFAMGTVSGANTRRYHGHLVAATKAPDRRHLALANIEALASVGTKTYGVSTNQYVGAIHPQGHRLISHFSTGDSVKWTFDLEKASLSKEIFLHPGSNTVSIHYAVESGEPVSLSLRPLVAHKFYHENF